MESRRALRAASAAHGPATIAVAALLAVLLGCDPIVRPGDGNNTADNQQGTGGDIFDNTGGGSGGGGNDPGATCGGGPYVFSISASDVDPWQDSGDIDGQGITTLWLWKADGGGLGAIAGDFRVQGGSDPSTFAQFQAAGQNLNIDRDGLPQVFLAVAGCEAGPVLLGQLTVYGLPDTLHIRLESQGPGSVAVDCCGNKPGWPIQCAWFEGILPDTTASDTTGVAAGA